MSFETGATGIGTTVSAQYGPRVVGNQEGNYPSKGPIREAALNFDGDALSTPVVVPAGVLAIGYVLVGTSGTVTTLVASPVDGTADVDIKAATVAAPVAVTKESTLEVTGITAGTVIVRYVQVA